MLRLAFITRSLVQPSRELIQWHNCIYTVSVTIESGWLESIEVFSWGKLGNRCGARGTASYANWVKCQRLRGLLVRSINVVMNYFILILCCICYVIKVTYYYRSIIPNSLCNLPAILVPLPSHYLLHYNLCSIS